MSGFLLAGIGHRTATNSNFLIVNQDTKLDLIEQTFKDLSTRDDVGIILINQHVANDIRHVLKDYTETIPTVLEIPSKEHPYDPEQDYIMQVRTPLLGLYCGFLTICFIHAARKHVFGWRVLVCVTMAKQDRHALVDQYILPLSGLSS